MNEIDFYNECADLLGTTYDCNGFPWTHSRRTRWNNRAPGHGRYPGFGLIRCFGNTVHVALQKPVTLHGIFHSKEEALTELKKLIQKGS